MRRGQLYSLRATQVRRGNPRDTASTEAEVAAQITFPVVGAFQVQASALYQPLDLEIGASPHEVVKMSTGVLERQRIRVYEEFRNHNMNLRRKRQEVQRGGI